MPILFLSRIVGFEHTKRGFEPQQKGGITPVRHRRILQGGEAIPRFRQIKILHRPFGRLFLLAKFQIILCRIPHCNCII